MRMPRELDITLVVNVTFENFRHSILPSLSRLALWGVSGQGPPNETTLSGEWSEAAAIHPRSRPFQNSGHSPVGNPEGSIRFRVGN